MKHASGTINLGMVLSLAGTLISLPINKKYHGWIGAVFTIFSLIHMYRHRQLLSSQIGKELPNLNFFQTSSQIAETIKQSYIERQFELVHYIPGRVRLHSKILLHNSTLESQITAYLKGMPEITSFTVNPVTGSILIEYLPAEVAKNSFLKQIESMILKKAKRG